jgi:allophanate hydrolase
MTLSHQIISLDILKLREKYSAKTLSPLEVIRHVYQEIASYHHKAVWIHLVPEVESIIRAQELTGLRPREKAELDT